MKILFLFILSIIIASCTASKYDKNLIPHFISPHNYDTITLGDTIKWTEVNGSDEYLLNLSNKNSITSKFESVLIISISDLNYCVIDSVIFRFIYQKNANYWEITSRINNKEYKDYNILTLYFKSP